MFPKPYLNQKNLLLIIPQDPIFNKRHIPDGFCTSYLQSLISHVL